MPRQVKAAMLKKPCKHQDMATRQDFQRKTIMHPRLILSMEDKKNHIFFHSFIIFFKILKILLFIFNDWSGGQKGMNYNRISEK